MSKPLSLPHFRPAAEFRIAPRCLAAILLIWLQSSSVSQAQDASTTITDGAATNAPAETPTGMAPANLPSAVGPTPGTPAMTPPAPSTAAAPSGNTDTTAPDQAPPTVAKAAHLYLLGKLDDALSTINAVILTDPKKGSAYIMRGAIYSGKADWDQAEKDYQTALAMDPNNQGVRYDLADLKFKQKKFDDARAAFVEIQDYKDSEIRDLIKYKIFLCDLLGGHDDVAGKELDAFNEVGSNASYYFSNAAWSLVHKKPEDARSWLTSASHIYSERKQAIYSSILTVMGYLPLPAPSDDK
jgi:tetratricopeptide (TPR) repeat protein